MSSRGSWKDSKDEEGREDSRKAGGTEARLTLEFAAGAKVVMFVL